MEVRLIGDCHGRFRGYGRRIEDVDFSIQLGDMGVGFIRKDGSYDINPPYDKMSEGRHLFIRGNHDNPSVCKRQDYWIPDGTFLDDTFYCIGGATSIDKAWRTKNYDWWEDEECSQQDLDRFVEEVSDLKPRMLTWLKMCV